MDGADGFLTAYGSGPPWSTAVGFYSRDTHAKEFLFKIRELVTDTKARQSEGKNEKTRGRIAEVDRKKEGEANYFSLFSIIIFCSI